ncbi:MAG TPA: 50S ribosomal protein L24 [Candidatus Limnocylindrales bacterium]|nr:50S ribosomal protein L24 [Candidatus Limnocylindrales bacterium]
MSVTRLKIRKGDEVMVIAGKDRGKRGRVQDVDPIGGTVVIAGVNVAKRHTKANPQKNTKGGIIEQPRPMATGKVMVICTHCGKPARLGHQMSEDTKERICKRCGEAIVIEEKA